VQHQERVLLGSKKLIRNQNRKELVQSLGYLLVVATLAMFLLDGGLSNLSDLPSWLDSLSRATSLVGTALLLVMLFLTARIPWVDQVLGQDRATAAHKRLGKPALYLILAHFALSLASYATTDGRNVVSELWWMVTTFEDLLTATISLVLMVAVVVSSFEFFRKLLRYESWFLTHLLSYAAVALAIPHIFSMGSDVVVSDVHRGFWIFLYLFGGLNILTFRVLLPLWNSVASGVRVSMVKRESSDSISIYLTGRKLKRFGAKAGQFFQVRFLVKGLWFQAHPFSISAKPTNSAIRFTIGDRGDGSKLMQLIQPGARVILEGPYGIFTQQSRTRKDVLLIGAGIGVPPIRALAEEFASQPGDINILYRTRDEEDSALLTELRDLSEKRGHNLHVASGARPKDGRWLSHGQDSDEEALLRMVPNVRRADVYICGPEQLTKSVEETLRKLGVPEHHIHSEEYAW
jgi:predicted ferric reductase